MTARYTALLILTACASALASQSAMAGFNTPIAFAQAGQVSITLDDARGGYDHVLELASSAGAIGASPVFYLSEGHTAQTVLGHLASVPGAVAPLGSVGAGSEWVFRLTNVESPRLGTVGKLVGQVFTGSASGLNAEPSKYYSLVEQTSPTSIHVTLEDLFAADPALSPTAQDFKNGADVSFTLNLSPVPEPTSSALVLAGLGVAAVLGTLAKRRGR